MAAEHLHPLRGNGLIVLQVAQDNEQRAVDTLTLIGCHAGHGGVRNTIGIGALIVNAYEAAHIDHGFQGLLAVNPVGKEDAGRAGHGQQVGIGSQCVLLQRILGGIGAALGVVILNEGHCQTAIGAILVVVADEWPVAVVLLRQAVPLPIVGSIAHRVAELKVEGCRCLLGGIDPVANGLRTVPAFADAVGGVAVLVVLLRIGAAVALDHVVAETHVAQVFEQHLQIGLHGVLHVGAGVVEVAHAIPTFASVLVAQADAKTIGLGLSLAIVVVRADVGGGHGVGDALVSLGGESEPAVVALAVVDDDVGNGAYAIVAESLDERAQFLLGAEGGVVVGEPVEVVVTHGLTAAVCALGQPDEREILAELLGLRLQHVPVGGIEGVPVEALQHDALVLGGPAIGSAERSPGSSQEGEHEQEGEGKEGALEP